MSDKADFLGWCSRLRLTETAREVVAVIRFGQPARCVGGGRRNVAGRYPSRKMGVTIQFERHRVSYPSFTSWSTILKCWSITTSRPPFRSPIERQTVDACR